MMKKPLIFSTLFMFFAAFAAIPEFQVTTLAAKGEPRKSALRKTAETFAARLSRTLKRKIAVVPFEKRPRILRPRRDPRRRGKPHGSGTDPCFVDEGGEKR